MTYMVIQSLFSLWKIRHRSRSKPIVIKTHTINKKLLISKYYVHIFNLNVIKSEIKSGA